MDSTLSKVIASLMTFGFCTGMLFTISILTMINGWGIEPDSWGWIIGGFVCSTIVIFMQTIIFAAIKDE